MAFFISFLVLLGVWLGLRFNVRLVGIASPVVAIAAAVTAVGSGHGWGEAIVAGIAALAALQLGYFLALVVGALGHARAEGAARPTETGLGSAARDPANGV